MESSRVVWNSVSLAKYMQAVFDEENLLLFAKAENVQDRSEVIERLRLIRGGWVSTYPLKHKRLHSIHINYVNVINARTCGNYYYWYWHRY